MNHHPAGRVPKSPIRGEVQDMSNSTAVAGARKRISDTTGRAARPTPQMKADALERGLAFGLWEALGPRADYRGAEPEIPGVLRDLEQFETGRQFGYRFCESARSGCEGLGELAAAHSREVGRYPESAVLRAEREKHEAHAEARAISSPGS